MLSRSHRRSATVVTAFTALSAAGLLTAATAFAANSIDVSGAGPSMVGVEYTCEASAGVTAIKAMLGDPNAEAPAATGTQTSVTCDGSQHTASIPLTAAGGQLPSSGSPVQVRAALVDQSDTVVTGTAKLLTAG